MLKNIIAFIGVVLIACGLALALVDFNKDNMNRKVVKIEASTSGYTVSNYNTVANTDYGDFTIMKPIVIPKHVTLYILVDKNSTEIVSVTIEINGKRYITQ